MGDAERLGGTTTWLDLRVIREMKTSTIHRWSRYGTHTVGVPNILQLAVAQQDDVRMRVERCLDLTPEERPPVPSDLAAPSKRQGRPRDKDARSSEGARPARRSGPACF
jgi:hypothetical protein